MSAADDKCTCCGTVCERDPVERAVTPRDADLFCVGCQYCERDPLGHDELIWRSPWCPLVIEAMAQTDPRWVPPAPKRRLRSGR